LECIVDWKPDVIAATLYLWNIERTLHLLRKVRRRLPFVKTIAGSRLPITILSYSKPECLTWSQ
jgi:hypothetical protein